MASQSGGLHAASTQLATGLPAWLSLDSAWGGGQMVELLASTQPPGEQRKDPLSTKWVGGVAFYGTRIDPDVLYKTLHPLKLIFGSEDHLVSAEQIGTLQGVEHELCKSGLFCDVQVFKGQPHGFVHLYGAGDTGAREEALQSGVDFLMALL